VKVLFYYHVPFSLAHGGAQIQIERTKKALAEAGVETEHLQWWNAAQSGDVLHSFGHLPLSFVRQARQKGLKVVITLLLTAQCNRSFWGLLTRQLFIRSALSLLPSRVKDQTPWQALHECDQIVVGLEAECRVLRQVYGLKPQQVSIVPLGLSETFLSAPAASRAEDHLICTGTIGPLKNSLQLGRLALQSQVPLLFVGKPHGSNNSYWQEFEKLINGRLVKHHPHVESEQEMVHLLGNARGYVLMSRYENWSLAAHEAAACGLPLLLPDQPWSRECFANEGHYFPKGGSGSAVAALREFYDRCPKLAAPQVRLFSWQQVAEKLQLLYARLLKAG